MQVRPLGQEDPLEEGMEIHSSILAWTIPLTEEPGGLQSIGLQRVRHNRSNLASSINHIHQHVVNSYAKFLVNSSCVFIPPGIFYDKFIKFCKTASLKILQLIL